MNCSVCGNEILDGSKFCANCGAAVKREMFCSNCGCKLMLEQKFCPQCGAPAETADSGFVGKKGFKKNKKQDSSSGKFKSNIVTKALKEVPGNVIDDQKAASIAKVINMHALGPLHRALLRHGYRAQVQALRRQVRLHLFGQCICASVSGWV